MNGLICRVLKAFALSAASTAVLLLILSAICSIADINDTAIRMITFAISVICVFFWSFLSARGANKGGLIHGGAVGIIYAVIFAVLSALCSGTFIFTPHIATTIFSVIIAGVLGGVMGINSGR